MKYFFLLPLMIAAAFTATGQTLITYGKNTVGADEFMRAYNKNKTPVADKTQALKEYLDLYTNFKLKVMAASELKLDTLPHIKEDIDNFRNQIQDNYLVNEKAMSDLYTEAYTRSKKDIHVIHFSVAVADGASPADTMKAYKAIQQISASLEKGNTDYQLLADNNSAIYPSKYADLGFVTAFTLPYQYENIIYELKPSQLSKPYRSKGAWHIFKSIEERPAAGKWKVAQILFSFPPSADDQLRTQTQNEADTVYKLLISGKDFTDMVQKYSDDKLTYMTGGELPEFGTGKFDQSFEREVFKLKADGEISKPFLTPYGIHIVKRVSRTLMPNDANDPSTMFELKQKIQKDSRIEFPRNQFAKQIMPKIGMKKLALVKESDLYKYADSSINNPDSINSYRVSKIPVLQFNKGNVTARDWFNYAVNYKGNPDIYKGESTKELWNKYLVYAAMEYYKKHMEEYNSDFRFQMKEFQEGNMLFEVMERNVWGKAASDSVGLKKYYQQNQSKYKWGKSADVLIFNSTDISTAEKALAAIQAGEGWKELAEKYATTIQVDSGRYELSQIISQGNATNPTPGFTTPLIKNSDGTASFVKFVNLYPGNEQRSYDEAKGLVINDYQIVLEDEWVKALRKKYPVTYNYAVLKTLAVK